MTSEEIRKSESGESKLGNETAYWLREIAAQFAELNERQQSPANQTVLFPCGCVFAQDGLDAEPTLKHHDGHDTPHLFQYVSISNGLCWCGEASTNPIHIKPTH